MRPWSITSIYELCSLVWERKNGNLISIHCSNAIRECYACKAIRNFLSIGKWWQQNLFNGSILSYCIPSGCAIQSQFTTNRVVWCQILMETCSWMDKGVLMLICCISISTQISGNMCLGSLNFCRCCWYPKVYSRILSYQLFLGPRTVITWSEALQEEVHSRASSQSHCPLELWEPYHALASLWIINNGAISFRAKLTFSFTSWIFMCLKNIALSFLCTLTIVLFLTSLSSRER